MHSQDNERFAATLAALAETFGRSPSPATIQGYWLALEDLTLAEVQAGIRSALRTCEYMPPPATIRRLAAPPAGPPLKPWVPRPKIPPAEQARADTARRICAKTALAKLTRQREAHSAAGASSPQSS